jgi:hypothetical protein
MRSTSLHVGIIGTETYRYLDKLPCVPYDIHIITKALTRCGANIPKRHVLSNPRYDNEVFNFLARLIGQAPDRNAFFIYLTGHGGQGQLGTYFYCLGSYPNLEDGDHPNARSRACLVDEDIKYFFGALRFQPKLVVVVFDACNRDIDLIKNLTVDRKVMISGRSIKCPEIMFVYGADVDYSAGYHPNGCSYYTEALAEALVCLRGRGTPEQIVNRAQETLRTRHPEQVSNWTYPLHSDLARKPLFARDGRATSQTHPRTREEGSDGMKFPFVELKGLRKCIRAALDCTHIRGMTSAELEAVVQLVTAELWKEIKRRRRGKQ